MSKHIRIRNRLHYIRKGIICKHHSYNYYLNINHYPIVAYISYYPDQNKWVHQVKMYMISMGGYAHVLNHNHYYIYGGKYLPLACISKGTVLALMFTDWEKLLKFIHSGVGTQLS